MKYFDSTIKRIDKARMAVGVELMRANKEVLRLTDLDNEADNDRYCDELGEAEERLEDLGFVYENFEFNKSTLNFWFGESND